MPQLLNLSAPASLLQAFADPRLVEAGLLTVISLEAIRERTGARWEAKAEMARDYVEREFRRRFGPCDQVLRLDDIRYLLLQPEETASTGRGRASNFLRDVLEFFLGSSSLSQIQVGRVTALGEAGVEQALLSIDEVREVMAEADRAPRTGEAPEPATPPMMFLNQPIWAVQKRAVASYRLRPLTFRADGRPEARQGALGEITTREVVELDLMVLDRALEILGAEEGRRFGLHVPIQIRTLNSQPGRQAILARIHASRAPTSEALVFCLEGLDAGVPRLVLDTAIAAVRSVCLGVVGQAPSLSTDVTAWRGARLSAVSFDFHDLTEAEEAELPHALAKFAAAAAAVGTNLIGESLTTRARVMAAWAAGFTQLSGDFLEGRGGLPFTPVRFEAAKLYETPAPAA